ncbi:disintegrin and metalloproteinase domain-containing protein 9-like isoform X2 [Hydra vulgaris]|uniref:Disintegrin and metalloproteinase domain-containing protein 9-like isoform X2 n=1 Tax=Hydra vulgaris TaxID=6087 RepID=A0ABM4BC49_HYDVU
MNTKSPQSSYIDMEHNGNHEEYVTYEIKAKKDHHFLDLKKIQQMHQKFIWLRSFENGKEVAVKHYPENCYYEGKVRGIEDSYAFISTCSGGLTGTVDDGKTRYDIIPQYDGIKHYYHNVENLMKEKYKEMKNSDIYENNKARQEKLYMKTERIDLLSDALPLNDVESEYLSYTRKETLYAEIFVSCDNEMLNEYDDNESLLVERVLNVFGQVDRAYQAINLRMVVVAIDIQKDTPSFPRYKESNDDIDSFGRYINHEIKKKSKFKDVDFDSAVFLSHNSWPGNSGKANLDTMCKKDCISIAYWEKISPTVHTIGHEFGHNLGFLHDEGKKYSCNAPSICLTKKRGCFMENVDKSNRPGFSNCSMATFEEKEYRCLLNMPSGVFHGITDDDDESVSVLSPPITAQYLRVLPKEWLGDYPCLRLKIIGCSSEQDCDVPLMKKLPVSAYSASSNYNRKFSSSGVVEEKSGWCSIDKTGSWLQINFKKRVEITSIVMLSTYWKTILYTLQYSDDGLLWFNYLKTNLDE